MDFRQLKALCAKEELPRFLLIHTADDYYIRECSHVICDAVRNRHGSDIGLTRLPDSGAAGGSIEPAGLLEELQSADMFSPVRAVLVTDSWKGFRKKQDIITTFINEGAETVYLVFFVDSIDKRVKAVKELVGKDWIVEFPKMYATPPPWKQGVVDHENDFAKWVRDRFRERKKKISLEDANRIVNRVGPDLNLLNTEIEKLDIYTDKKDAVTGDDIQSVVVNNSSDNIFEIVDVLLEGRYAAAMNLCREVMAAGALMGDSDRRITNPSVILNSILLPILHRKLRKIWHAVNLAGQGLSREAIVRELGIHKFFSNQFFDQARRFKDRARLAGIFSLILDCDMKVKSGASSPLQAFEELVVQMRLLVS